VNTPLTFDRDRSDGHHITLESWLRRHKLLAYFALAYSISWGGILIVLIATGFDLSALMPFETSLLFVFMLLGPSTSGLTLTVLLDGRAGMRELGSRLVLWRVGARWYAVALLTTPLFLLAILWLLSAMVHPAFAPRFQWALLAIGLVAGACEEIGWTGFATPLLLTRQSPGMAGLSLGLVWALWHVLVDFRYNAGTMGMAWPLEFAVVYVATLTPYRILMTWVYAHTPSLLLAVLMHASYTGWLLVLFPTTSFAQGLLWQSAFAVMLWVAAAVVLCRSTLRAKAAMNGRLMAADAALQGRK
jgi:membrane protease YdiL (CAAX protease family)